MKPGKTARPLCVKTHARLVLVRVEGHGFVFSEHGEVAKALGGPLPAEIHETGDYLIVCHKREGGSDTRFVVLQSLN